MKGISVHGHVSRGAERTDETKGILLGAAHRWRDSDGVGGRATIISSSQVKPAISPQTRPTRGVDKAQDGEDPVHVVRGMVIKDGHRGGRDNHAKW